jgi:hypothetical protein
MQNANIFQQPCIQMITKLDERFNHILHMNSLSHFNFI